MDTFESDTESDFIDDTGCEEHMQDTYWDINYMQRIAADDVYEEDEENENEEEKPEARPIRRFTYKEENDDGDVVKEYYTEPQDEEESYDEYSSSSDSSYVFLSQFIV